MSCVPVAAPPTAPAIPLYARATLPYKKHGSWLVVRKDLVKRGKLYHCYILMYFSVDPWGRGWHE